MLTIETDRALETPRFRASWDHAWFMASFKACLAASRACSCCVFGQLASNVPCQMRSNSFICHLVRVSRNATDLRYRHQRRDSAVSLTKHCPGIADAYAGCGGKAGRRGEGGGGAQMHAWQCRMTLASNDWAQSKPCRQFTVCGGCNAGKRMHFCSMDMRGLCRAVTT